MFVAALAVAMVGQQSCPAPQPKVTPEKLIVTGVQLRTVSFPKSGPKEIESFREIGDGRLWPSNHFELRVTLKMDKGVDDAVVWTETQFLFAPMFRNFVSGQLDPVRYVSWGWNLPFKDVAIQRTTVGAEESSVSFGPFDLTPILPRDPKDNLWPWALRVIVHVEPVDGPASTFTSSVYRLKPSVARQKLAAVDYDPAAPDGEPIPMVPEQCRGTELDSHPK